MKSLNALLGLIALLVSNAVFAHATIGVLDLDRALFETEAWQQEMTELNQQLQEDQESAITLQQELAELQKNLQINAPTLSISELQRFQEEGQFKRIRLQQIGERVQAVIRESQASFLERYRQLLGDAVNEVTVDGSYDLILRADSVVVSGFSLDVTSKVTAKLNDFIAELNQ
jgi:outer membrane protein